MIKTIKQGFKQMTSFFKKSSIWTKVIVFVIIALIFTKIANANTPRIEGFSQNRKFVVKKNKSIENSLFKVIFFGEEKKYYSIPIKDFSIQNDTISFLTYDSGFYKKLSLKSLYSNHSGYIFKKFFYLGTDKYGRDLLSRLILATRISFSVGFISVFISLIIGVPLGLLSGYYGGIIDKIILWFINIIWSIPTLLMVIAITLALGKGYWQVFIAVGLTMWVEIARVVRGQAISITEVEYIKSARVIGFNDLRIMFKHILPNIINPIYIISASNFASAILLESGLSFLGIGVQPPTPSWGGIVKDHYTYIILDKFYLALFPGILIIILVFAFMNLGNIIDRSEN